MASPAEDKSKSMIIFLSPGETRLRAGWRLILHGVIFLFFMLLFGAMVVTGSLLAGRSSESVFEEGAVLLTFLISIPSITLSTLVARRWLDRKSFTSLGFHWGRYSLRDLAVGILIPGFIMGMIFLVEWAAGWLEIQSFAWEEGPSGDVVLGLLGGLLVYIAVGYQEELLSRGYQLQNLIEGSNLRIGIFLSSLIFAALHLGNPFTSFRSTVGLIFAGFFLAYGWVLTKQLWLSIGLHIGWNFFEGNVFGFPVSGTDSFRLVHHTINGPDWITGGSFGPEAGFIVLPGMLFGALLIWTYSEHGRGEHDQLPNPTA